MSKNLKVLRLIVLRLLGEQDTKIDKKEMPGNRFCFRLN
jgi:hypothetical protein